jgi:hypothetical protein
MRNRVATVVVLVGLLSAVVLLGTRAIANDDHEGVRLGAVWAPSQQGYGEVEPSRIHNGGDPAGMVEDVRWTGWGEAIAIGTGFAYIPHTSVADSTREPVVVVAFELGECDGETAYEAVDWFRPQAGEQFDADPAAGYDICAPMRSG